MKRVLVFGAIALLMLGCQGMFGELPGQHWRITLDSAERDIGRETVRTVGDTLAARLNLVVLWVNPERDGWPVSFVDLSDSAQPGKLRVVLHVDRRDGTLVLETRYHGRRAEAERIEQTEMERALRVIKELFPRSTGAPFKAYQGLLGP